MLVIPKSMHRFWVGGKIPAQHQEWIDQWSRLHPDWDQYTWDEPCTVHLLDSIDPVLADMYYLSANPAQQSDIARFAILQEYGGVYLDTDFRPIKEITELLHGCDCFTVQAREDGGVCSGLMGSTPQHPFITDLLAELITKFNPDDQLTTGPLMVEAMRQGRDDVRVLERKLFFPYTWKDASKLSATEQYQGAYAVHHFAHSWKR